MKIDPPRRDLGDLDPSWEGNVDQFTEVRRLLTNIFWRYRDPYWGPDDNRLDKLVNSILLNHRSFTNKPEDSVRIFRENLNKNSIVKCLFIAGLEKDDEL